MLPVKELSSCRGHVTSYVTQLRGAQRAENRERCALRERDALGTESIPKTPGIGLIFVGEDVDEVYVLAEAEGFAEVSFGLRAGGAKGACVRLGCV